MIKLETTTKNGSQVMAHTITKKLSITIDELIIFAKAINLNIKSVQDLLSASILLFFRIANFSTIPFETFER